MPLVAPVMIATLPSSLPMTRSVRCDFYHHDITTHVVTESQGDRSRVNVAFPILPKAFVSRVKRRICIRMVRLWRSAFWSIKDVVTLVGNADWLSRSAWLLWSRHNQTETLPAGQ
jgi:hypothetical protein